MTQMEVVVCTVSRGGVLLCRPTRRLTLEIRLQYRKPARYQRTTVSGVTTRRTCFQADEKLRPSTQKSLCRGLSWARECTALKYRELLAKRQILQQRAAT